MQQILKMYAINQALWQNSQQFVVWVREQWCICKTTTQ